MKFIIFILFLASCASQFQSKDENKMLMLHKSFIQNKKKDEILKIFGRPDQTTEDGIIYYRQNLQSPQIGIFFNNDNVISSAFCLADENELVNIKKLIVCDWDEQNELIKRSHYFKEIKIGKCNQHGISYNIMEKSNYYEIRWERSQILK
jgi:hypothetical protein